MQLDRGDASSTLNDRFGGRSRMISILYVENSDDAVPLLEALEAGGIGLIEVTLRTPAALKVIETMSRKAKKALVGAGTLTKPSQFPEAREAGAQFLVSPALSHHLAEAAERVRLPFLPGATTPTEVLQARQSGFQELKFIPSDLNGGIRWLQHLFPLFPDVSFCPTGGISDTNSNDISASQMYLRWEPCIWLPARSSPSEIGTRLGSRVLKR
ncbi:bifunctional 4-hydroxy-2-oxoglutarate aldolase/2-dehydro-3-deoxy-phosphogluconate aldolase [Bradyrhizobium genosp. L]|uniref:bifunctional 4-hydroxy-2-oxoglutarate aldolase/2-dehydro-3-deoxy-phosphogluconate aldolase n=1 Tax=Bradyrhizobium genosp. L TaxID=83637 RepID=UPI0018A31E88|nr:bifunctional 4-hydroxy-2-oxoglutarate aldolase/2-dehydro-3-deoxy-phosphogluconate aldolase [Bradyrhizobium genosp. L]QPF83859.1 bifunctional 4-hydroxy-2-oxoglutarate aldolase/2-dehydro-3-deoxy-phosphogluconate aldolase [Bradyrhizobium genosp. L]